MTNEQYGTNVELDSGVARKILESVGGPGIPPEYGFQYFTAGLSDYLNTIDEEYIRSFVRDGGSTFKLVIGRYGGGKTHFLYCIRDSSWKSNYVVSYIILTPGQTPFHKLEQVYKAVVANLTCPPEDILSGYDRGIEATIKMWYNQKYQEISRKVSGDNILQELRIYASSLEHYDSGSFRNAVKEAFLSLAEAEERDDDFSLIMQWLAGENPPKNMLKNFKIFERIDKSTAFKMIRSLIQWTKEIGYSGLIVLMDEAEQISSMTGKQQELLLNNLRQLVDETSTINSFKNTMWFYAVPDENFLEGKTGGAYMALKQRVSSVFDTEINPRGVRIDLNKIPIKPVDLLKDIGTKLAQIYEVAYDVQFDRSVLEETIDNIVEAAYEKAYETSYERLFVTSIVKAFDKLRKTGETVLPEDIDM
jgi:hypothetical protein